MSCQVNCYTAMIAQMSHPYTLRGNTRWCVLPICACRASSLMALNGVDIWVRQAQHGDASAIEALYQHYVEAIYRYIFYRVSSQRDAEDLTAEVFVRMVEGLPSYRFTGAPFEAWL